jgi:signal transduction histidine kinase
LFRGSSEKLQGRGASWTAITRQALLLALPLVILCIVGSELLDADLLVSRNNAYVDATQNVDALGSAAELAVTGLGETAMQKVADAVKGGDDSVGRLSQKILDSDFPFIILIRRDSRRLFPPLDNSLAVPRLWEDWLRPLEAAVDLRPDGGQVSGWYPSYFGAWFFDCRREGKAEAREETCIAIAWPQVKTALVSALDRAGDPPAAWSFRLRDPFDRIVWSHGAEFAAVNSASDPFINTFDLKGALRGWRIEAQGAPAPRHGALGRIALAAPLAAAWMLLVWQMLRTQKARMAESAARSQLSARLSHDLRTPLANLKLYAGLIACKSESEDNVLRYCDVIEHEIDRLDGLVGNAIAFALNSSRQTIRLGRASPDAIALNAIERLQPLLSASGCVCKLAGGAALPRHFDLAGFERILFNLIDNARKYAPGRIDVATSFDGDRLCLSVRDYGSGLQAKAPSSIDGFGLGLDLVRDLAKASGGGLTIKQCNPGALVMVTMTTHEAS